MNTVLVYVTAATREDAVTLGRDVVGRRLAACANILGEMTSIYRWQGEIAEDSEVATLLKTRRRPHRTAGRTDQGASRLRLPLRRCGWDRRWQQRILGLDRRGNEPWHL